MGGKLSKKIKGNEQKEIRHPPRPPSPPYYGPSAKYHFVTCEVAIKHHINFAFLSTSIVTSNIDTYYPILAEHHATGLKLLTFYRIPGQVRIGAGFSNPGLLVQFQGIHCSYPSQEGHSQDAYELRVEKSVIQPGFVSTPFFTHQSQVVTDTQHLFQTLARYADSGARLICIEITGQEKLSPALFGTNMPAMGCDMFFDVPRGNVTEKYVYTCVYIPVNMTITPGFTNKVKVDCDWRGKLAEYLNQGWRLVEIFYDQSSQHQMSGFTTTGQLNSQWYFEKPVSRVNDPTPCYEGMIVEHEIHIKGGETTAKWEPIIQEKGNKGWELACILETPEQRISVGLVNTLHQKTLLFFQRELAPSCMASSSDTDKPAMKLPPEPL